MSIVPHDIPAAVRGYVAKLVTVKVSEVAPTAPKQTVLTSGDADELPLTPIFVNPGTAKIGCHVHADVDRDDLFPNSGSDSAGQGLTVL